MKNKIKNKEMVYRMLAVGIILILFSLLMGVSAVLYKEKNKTITLDDVQEFQKKQIDTVINKISKHMTLPNDEKPTIATITDANKLTDSMPFFEKAQNGFKIVVYSEKAILFDPIKNIIVDVAPVVQGKQQSNENVQQNIKQKIIEEKKQDDIKNVDNDVEISKVEKENNEGDKIIVNIDSEGPVNVREQGSITAKKIMQIKETSEFKKIGYEDDWVQILISNEDGELLKGWVHSKFVNVHYE